MFNFCQIPLSISLAVTATLLAGPQPALAAPVHAQEEERQHQDEDGHHDHGHGGVLEEVIVQATRTGRRIGDEATRVEVIVREEIEEKLLMRPGNIAMLVNETPGVRAQVTSPALGAANIRILGLFGRYTQLLADGLPLYGGQVASIGLLQVPPTDLGQVEIIKGAASALYGASALGGVINLVSRQPTDEAEAETLLNITTRNGQDLTAYAATPLSPSWAGSMTIGAHRQGAQDFDADGWADMPDYQRWMLRPRLFWASDDGASAYLTAGMMAEERSGGTLPGGEVANGQAFVQAQDTNRYDLGLRAQMPLRNGLTAALRGSAMRQDNDRQYGDDRYDDHHQTVLLEATLASVEASSQWVAGLAYQSDKYHASAYPQFDYHYQVPGAFVQWEQDLSDTTSLVVSARYDHHSEYGRQFSPRLAAVYRPGNWTLRATLGSGFFAPTPFVDEIEAAGLSRLEPLENLQAETALTGSVDIGFQRGPFEGNLTLFISSLDEVARLEPFASAPGAAPDRVRLINSTASTRINGSELLVRYRWNRITLTGSYVYLDASEENPDSPGRRPLDRTPEHTGGLVLMWEEHGRFRVGAEAYYTGRQSLYENPYRESGSAYVHLGILGEVSFGNISWFINFENLLDVRQTDEDPLPVPTRRPDGQWTVNIWSPTDGFIVNGGLRYRF